MKRRLKLSGIIFIPQCMIAIAVFTTILINPLVVHADDGYIAVGKASDFKAGQFKQVIVKGSPIYVGFQIDKPEKVLTYSAKCPVDDCYVLWQPAKLIFTCPCDENKYGADGKNAGNPAAATLASLKSKIEDDEVFVKI